MRSGPPSHAGLRDLHADVRLHRVPVGAPVVEDRLRRLAADVARLARLLRVQGERVGLLEPERGVVGLDPTAPRLAVEPVDRGGVRVDRKDLALARVLALVVVRVRRVPVGDEQPVLVREVLDPVRAVLREPEVVRPALQVLVV